MEACGRHDIVREASCIARCERRATRREQKSSAATRAIRIGMRAGGCLIITTPLSEARWVSEPVVAQIRGLQAPDAFRLSPAYLTAGAVTLEASSSNSRSLAKRAAGKKGPRIVT